MTGCNASIRNFDNLLALEFGLLKEKILQHHRAAFVEVKGGGMQNAETLSSSAGTAKTEHSLEPFMADEICDLRCPVPSQKMTLEDGIELWPVWLESTQMVSNHSTVNPFMDRAATIYREAVEHRSSISNGAVPFRYVIHPYSEIRFFWDIIAAALLATDLVITPLSFLPELLNAQLPIFEHMDYVSAVFWQLDMLLSFITGFDVGGIVEMQVGRIAKRYISTWFISDIVLLLLDYVNLFFSYGFPLYLLNKFSRLSQLLRFVRLIRLVKTTSMLKKLVDSTQSLTLINTANIMKIVFIIMLMNHWIACGYCVIAQSSLGDDDIDAWFYVYTSPLHSSNSPSRYLIALHWAVVQFISAFHTPSNEGPDRVYAICTSLVGLISISLFVGRVASEFDQMYAVQQDRLNDEAKLRRYFTENHVPTDLAIRINRFLRRNYQGCVKRMNLKDISFFENLPLSLRMELHREVFMPTVVFHPLFHRYEIENLAGLVLLCQMALVQQSWFEGQDIFVRGTAATDMYFVVVGKFEYSAFEVATSLISGQGKCFCEAVLFVKWHCRGHLFASMPSQLLGMNAKKFHSIAREHSFQQLRQYAVLFADRVRRCQCPSDLSDVELVEGLVANAFGTLERTLPQDPLRPSSDAPDSNLGSQNRGYNSKILATKPDALDNDVLIL